MPDQATKSENSVLDSLHRRFVDETYGVNGLFFESIFKTQENLAHLVIGDNSEQLFAKSRVVHGGIHDWLEALVKLAHSYAGRLTAIIMADSQICSSENPAQWIRLWLEDHLRKYLRQELNLEKLAHEDWKNRIAEKVPASESEGHSASNGPSRKRTWSRVESWLRRVADDDWAADDWPDGPPPWLAPVWCEEECFVKIMLKKTGACPDRLTLKQTACLIQMAEHEFAARLEYVLGVEEDEARLTFAQRSASGIVRKSAADEESALAVLPQDERLKNKRESVMQSLLAKRGWSINDLAVNAGVDFHTANAFLKGLVKSYPSTRKKLADALGVKVDELPA